jgi:hypothetical protein
MKICLLIIFLFFIKTLSSQEKTITDIFLQLPDSFFTHHSHSGFSKNDSFPVKERKRALGEFDSTYKHYIDNPLFNLVSVNDTNHLLKLDNGVYSISFKYWRMSKNKLMIGIIYTITDFVEPRQKILIFQYDKQKYTPLKHIIPVRYPLNLFFEESALKKDSIGENETIDRVHYNFSERKNVIEISPQSSQFEADYASDQRFVKLDLAKMKREFISLKLRKGSFIIVDRK